MLLAILGKNYVSGGIISYISCIYVKIKLKIYDQTWGDLLNVLFKLCIFHILCK